MNNIIYDIWFSSLDIENVTKLLLIKENTAEKIWNFKFEDFEEYNINKEEIEKILRAKNLDYANIAYQIMNQNNIKLFSIKDECYPRKLHQIEDKPSYLYVRGNVDILDDDAVGIVGCRMATNSGKSIARNIAKNLADRNINIVSGLALGIDKYAHLGALDSNIGKTIAVLGCGISDDEVYPYQNKKVFERIIENGGAIVSEYCIGSRPEKNHFPYRNRIISGLSDKIIVVEAKKRSGSLITANIAIDQGKDVFAVPGNIYENNNVGTNNLIKEGAFLFSSIEDVFV